MKLKIKVSCAAILDRCTVPWAVLVADIQIVGKPNTRTRYVLLDPEIRDGVSRMRRALAPVAATSFNDYGSVLRMLDPECAFPSTIRTHAFDANGVQYEPSEPLRQRVGIWSNGEPLWIRTDLARVVLADLTEWQTNVCPSPQQIAAPSWNALLGAQALAIAAGLPLPLVIMP